MVRQLDFVKLLDILGPGVEGRRGEAGVVVVVVERAPDKVLLVLKNKYCPRRKNCDIIWPESNYTSRFDQLLYQDVKVSCNSCTVLVLYLG